MSERSKVDGLPSDVRAELERMLIDNAFSEYSALTEWLQDAGFDVSRSAVHRFGKKFEDRLKKMQLSTQMALDLVNANPDDQGKLNEATMRLLQDRIFTLLMELDADAIDPKSIAALTKAVSQLSRADIHFRIKMKEMKDKAEQVADKTSKIAKSGGLSAEQAEMFRRDILGIAAG